MTANSVSSESSPLPSSPLDAGSSKPWQVSQDDWDLAQPSTISCLFKDATLYKKAIDELSSPRSKLNSLAEEETTNGFAELVGQDLDQPEKDVASQFAQISVKDWTPQDDDFDNARPLTEEPESFGEQSSSESSEGTTAISTDPGTTTTDRDEEVEPYVSLSSDQVIQLLTQEFGALAPDGEEKLVLEADGAVIQDVVVLGVVHITTHRISFHASMPLLDPSLSGSNNVIKAGPALVHRKGLHRKKRVWLELSQDFVSTFPSAREEDRIRPWRSVMLTSILEVSKEDPERPRVMQARLDSKTGLKDGYLEFDTIESAREWRRELQAALFFSRRKLRNIIANADADDIQGVRIGIPLDHILYHTRQLHANTLPIITLTVGSSGGQDSPLVPTSDAPAQSIQIAFNKLAAEWDRLDSLIKASKLRRDSDGLVPREKSVVIDFGLGDYLQKAKAAGTDAKDIRSKEQVVCDILAIDYSENVWVTRACLTVGLACTGFLVVSPRWIGFWSKSLTLRDVRYRLAASSIQKAVPTEFIIRSLPIYGMLLEIEGHSNLKFQFRSQNTRDESIQRINAAAEQERLLRIQSAIPSPSTFPTSPGPLSPTREASIALPASRPQTPPSPHSQGTLFSPLSRTFSRVRGTVDVRKVLQFPKAVNVPPGVMLRMPPKHFVCLTIGSRGDVQPYIALGLGLKSHGHRVTIVTHEEYKGWIEGFGLHHRQAGGDPGALMKLSVENKMFSPQFFKTSLANYRTWLDQLLHDAWESCRDAEILLESPYAMAGVHIAEALHIPYFRVCTMPWTKTVEFPQPFISPPVETPTFNSISYVLFDNIFWTATSSQINRWRKSTLDLAPTVMSHVAQSKIPILYNFSPAVVPKPLDWSDSKIICGYWFLDNPDLDWKAPESLLLFMEKARKDGKPLVYIGFGSITVPDPKSMTEHIVQAVTKSGVRAVISRGWSNRMSKVTESDVEIPEECYMIDKVPHDWLFPLMDAALHHGGAGTTGASLRAGIPTLIKPWFGDQYFWASRVHKLGAGMRVPSLRVADLSDALIKATTDRVMKEKASIVGQRVRTETGVLTAIRAIYTYLPRASSEGITPE